MSSELHFAAPASATEDIAQLCKAAGDPLRAEILCALATDSYGVLELSHAFETKQSGMSHHLKVLANAGLVATRREGNSVFYRRAPLTVQDPYRSLKSSLFAALGPDSLGAKRQERLVQVHADRARRSQLFFLENADKFREQQDLIASFPAYGEQVAELLQQTPLPGRRYVLEVGPGEGELLPHLAAEFEQVLGLDSSAAMLARAAERCAGNPNIKLVNGDTTCLVRYPETFDCAVMNMVLHHTSSPRQLFADIGVALRSGGALLVTDLCRHDQAWVTEACGDLWLGFEPSDLAQWAWEAGLEEGQTMFIALRNGFQIQVRQFFKNEGVGHVDRSPQ